MMKKYDYVVNKNNVENRMFDIILAQIGKPIEQGIIIKAIAYTMDLGTLTLTGQCPVDLIAGRHTMLVQYTADDGSITRFGNTKWDETIMAGDDFTINFKLPKEMFTITVVPVKKSILKTVYNYVAKFRRNKK